MHCHLSRAKDRLQHLSGVQVQKDSRVRAVGPKAQVKGATLPMRVTGMPYSSAETAVHFPVPFCPALSRIFGNSSLPSVSRNLRILAVISIRKESSSVLFHSSNAYTLEKVGWVMWAPWLICRILASIGGAPTAEPWGQQTRTPAY